MTMMGSFREMQFEIYDDEAVRKHDEIFWQ